MPIKRTIDDTRRPIHIWTDDIETEAEAQLRRTADLPFVFKHVAVMPDVHAGKGSTIGTVIATRGAIVPACVGVDLGCGMSAVKLPGVKEGDLDRRLGVLRSRLEAAIPVGFDTHARGEGVRALGTREVTPLFDRLRAIDSRCRLSGKASKVLQGLGKVDAQLGTLGGGNHFIELCVSKKDEIWLLLHSGSRGVGNLIAQHHIEVAKAIMRAQKIELPDTDLAYLTEGSEAFAEYLHDMRWAQDFAYWNRRAMQALAVAELRRILPLGDAPVELPSIDCHHNYVAEEVHFGRDVLVTRKGAVRAQKGDLGIIPGSMGAKSYIVRGLGNPEAFHSCSHGAGRRMSRTKARKVFTAADLAAQTRGVECRKDDRVLDEIPGAYKDIDVVMAHQSDLVEILEELRQVVCVKG